MIRRSVFALVPLALLVAGCPAKDSSSSFPDVWVSSGAGPVRILLEGDTGFVVNTLANSVDALDAIADLPEIVAIKESSGDFSRFLTLRRRYAGRASARSTKSRSAVVNAGESWGLWP